MLVPSTLVTSASSTLQCDVVAGVRQGTEENGTQRGPETGLLTTLSIRDGAHDYDAAIPLILGSGVGIIALLGHELSHRSRGMLEGEEGCHRVGLEAFQKLYRAGLSSRGWTEETGACDPDIKTMLPSAMLARSTPVESPVRFTDRPQAFKTSSMRVKMSSSVVICDGYSITFVLG